VQDREAGGLAMRLERQADGNGTSRALVRCRAKRPRRSAKGLGRSVVRSRCAAAAAASESVGVGMSRFRAWVYTTGINMTLNRLGCSRF
jgi:hypothetical protein